jgi:hypothetical protein
MLAAECAAVIVVALRVSQHAPGAAAGRLARPSA